MRYLKTYEEINDNPEKVKIGDYVLLHTFTPMDEYLDITIGKIHWIDENEKKIGVNFPPEKPVGMRFDFDIIFKVYQNRREQCEYAYRKFKKQDIVYSSENKEELEIIISANKYNL